TALSTPHSGPFRCAVFQRQEKTLLSSTGSQLRLWDMSSGKSVGDLSNETKLPVRSAAFSPDGRMLATGDYDGRLYLSNLIDGRSIVASQHHDGEVVSLAFSPDGKIVLSGSRDHTARLWDASTGE